MRIKNYFLIFIIIIFSRSLPCLPQKVEKSNILEYKLENGLTFLIVERHIEKGFSLFMRIKVGSIDEQLENSGISHLLEHIFLEELSNFIDPLSLKKEAIFRIGAETTKELTTYYFKLPSSYYIPLLLNISKKLRNPSFESLEEKKKEVIKEIGTKSGNIPRAKLFDAFVSLAFLRHPYRMPTWGLEESIEKLSKTQVERFFFENYTPSNIVIAIVGDVNKNEILDIIKENYQYLPLILKKRKYFEEISLNGEKGERRLKFYTYSTPYIMIGFYKPVFPDREDYIFDLTAYLLEDYLKDSLINKRKVASLVRVFVTPGLKFPNLFVIEALPSKESPPLENSIFRELKMFLSHPLARKYLDKAKTQIKDRLNRVLTSNFLLADNLSYYEALFENWEYIFEYSDFIDKINFDDVRKIMLKYLIGTHNKVIVSIEKNKGG